jgi:tetratricopeptide (TPR) repeat protein
VEVAPNDADAWNKLGIARNQIGLTNDAIAAYTEAIGRDPTFWRAFANRSTLYWNLDKAEAALEDLTSALAHEPNHANLWRNRSAAYQKLGKPIDALACMLVAAQLAPKDTAIQEMAAEQRAELARRSADEKWHGPKPKT